MNVARDNAMPPTNEARAAFRGPVRVLVALLVGSAVLCIAIGYGVHHRQYDRSLDAHAVESLRLIEQIGSAANRAADRSDALDIVQQRWEELTTSYPHRIPLVVGSDGQPLLEADPRQWRGMRAAQPGTEAALLTNPGEAFTQWMLNQQGDEVLVVGAFHERLDAWLMLWSHGDEVRGVARREGLARGVSSGLLMLMPLGVALAAVFVLFVRTERHVTKLVETLDEQREALAFSERRLAAAQTLARIGTWTFSPSDKSVTWDDLTHQVMGQDAATFQVSYLNSLDLLHPDDRTTTDTNLKLIVDGRKSQAWHLRRKGTDGEWRYIHVSGEPVLDEHGDVLRIEGVVQDVTEKQNIEQLLRQIVEGTSQVVGQDFFRVLTRQLARTLKMRIVVLGEFIANPHDHCQVLAGWDGDQPLSIDGYTLLGTPCALIRDQDLVYYADDVASSFPTDAWIRERGVRSYLGVPLVNARGEHVGQVAVFDDKPMPSREPAESIMRIFASRAVAELQRMHAEERLRHNQQRLEVLNFISHRITVGDNAQAVVHRTIRELGDVLHPQRVGFASITGADPVTLEHIHMAGPARDGAASEWSIAANHPTLAQLKRGDMLELSRDAKPDEACDWLDHLNCRACLVAPLLDGNRLMGVLTVDAVEPVSWSSHECRLLRDVADLLALANRQSEVQQQRDLARQDLEYNRAFLDLAQGIAHVGSWDWDLRSDRVTWSDEMYRIFGFDRRRADVSFNDLKDMVHPEDRVRLVEAQDGTAARETSGPIEYRIIRPDGLERTIRAENRYFREGGSQITRVIGTVQDITEQKDVERQRKLLMDELDHRVKNMLAAIVSLADQTACVSKDLPTFRQAYVGRLRAMARAHEALATSGWQHVSLKQMARQVLGVHMQEPSPRMRIDGRDLHLPPHVATPMSLALYELATNALKYGSLSVPQGSVELSWHLDEALTMTWREVDGPSIVAPETCGLGTDLIRGLIQYELNGNVAFSFEPQGLVCKMQIPAATLTRQPDGSSRNPTNNQNSSTAAGEHE